MKHKRYLKFYLAILLGTMFPFSATAQITPDRTLGAESSKVNTIDELRDKPNGMASQRIEGGAIRGDNLFHSFKEFGIPEGTEIYFANPTNIKNIFSRVTGGNISEIFGILAVEGNANLFLMNPNGIVFGENAAINVGGSFIATTAESIEFKDGKSFSATNPSKSPLLTVEVPIGLGFGGNSGDIIVKGEGHNLIDPFIGPIQQTTSSPDNGLQLQHKQTLGLIGGNVTLEGGILTAEGGHIELGSIDRGRVSFITNTNSSKLSFNYGNVTEYKDIQLLSRALINASGFVSGSIDLKGANIDVVDGSAIWLQNRGSQSGKIIDVNATGNLQIAGSTGTLPGVRSGIYSETISEGRSADLNISANNLTISDDGAVSTITYNLVGNGGDLAINTNNLNVINGGNLATASTSMGNGGDLIVDNQNSLKIVGFSSLAPDNFSSIFSSTSGNGKGGNIEVHTGSLLLKNTGNIGTRVTITGQGQGGNVKLNVLDTTRILGNIDSDNFTVLSSISLGSGNAGSIVLDTHDLIIKDKAAIAASSFSQGNAGEILVNVTNRSQITNGTISSSVEEFPQNISPIYNSKIPPLIGDAGKIIFNSPRIEINNSGSIAVGNLGTGDGGGININASEISLDNNSAITAATASGQGGNINLNTDSLSLLDNSLISATAGVTGDGGNITINSNTILGLNNSDITANAFKGDGGNINITANGILGIEERKAIPNNITSDIDASSEFGESGTITITNPQLTIQDPIVAIREVKIDNSEEKRINLCSEENPNRGGSRLVYTGRGGFPESPYDPIDNEEYIAAPGFVPPVEEKQEEWELPAWKEKDPVVQGNAVRIDKKGEIYLVAELSPQEARELLCNNQPQKLKN